MLPLNRGLSGLTEKRLPVSNGLEFSHAATQVGDKNKAFADTMLLDDEIGLHTVNAEDPGSSTLNFADSADLNMIRVRGIEHSDILSQHVHVIKEGVEASPTQYELTANETINVGQPVYVSAADTVNLADADTLSTSHVLGLAVTDATANQTVLVLSDGSVERSDWTAVIGTANLTPGVVYYLSATAGQLTSTPPTGDGDHVVRCGVAVNATKFDIEINEVAIL